MRKIFTFFAVSLATTFYAEAKIWRVNNNAGINANFTDIQPAHDAAASGDTIMVEPSMTAYGNLVVKKPLVLLGPGYFLAENTGKQDNLINAKIGVVNFDDLYNTANALVSTSSGSIMSGLEVTGQVFVGVSNININRCKINAGIAISEGTSPLGFFSISNIVIYQNYIKDSSVGASPSSSVSPAFITNIIVKNNILVNSPVNIYDKASGIVENNTFILGNAATISLSSSTYRSNIFISNNAISFSGKNSTISNNIFNTPYTTGAGSTGLTFTTNPTNANPLDVFVTDPAPATPATGFTSDSRYTLKTGSPAIGAGYNGVDAGAFGSATPYILSGIPAIPTIYLYDVPTSAQSTLNVKMSVRSNP